MRERMEWSGDLDPRPTPGRVKNWHVKNVFRKMTEVLSEKRGWSLGVGRANPEEEKADWRFRQATARSFAHRTRKGGGRKSPYLSVRGLRGISRMT